MKKHLIKLIVLLLTLIVGIGQMWAWNWETNQTVIWDVGASYTNWTSAYFTVGNGGGNAGFKSMTRLGSSGQFVYKETGSNWDNYGWASFFKSESWGNNQRTTEIGQEVNGKMYVSLNSQVSCSCATNEEWNWQVVSSPVKGTSGYTIYFDDSETQWGSGNIYFKYGVEWDGSTTEGFNRKIDFSTTKVPGTDNLYKLTASSSDESNQGSTNASGQLSHDIYFTKWYVSKSYGYTNQHPITDTHVLERTAIYTDAISQDYTLIPTAVSSGEGTDGDPKLWTTTKINGHTYNVSISDLSGGTIKVKYTSESNTSDSLMSGNRDLARTCIITVTATPNTGYKLTSLTRNGASFTSGDTHIVKEINEFAATFVAKQSTITFSQSGAGYASGTPASNTATYGVAMTAITPPTAATGYKFQGYFDGENGTGTKYYNADGSSAQNWDKDTEDGTTLYAYFEKAQITLIEFSPATAAGKTKVVATPTISPSPVGTTIICWKLFKDAECTHDMDSTFKAEEGSAVSFNTPEFAGLYYVQAILRAGDNCASSVLDSVVYQYIVASDHTVTVKYMCDGVAIHTPTEVVVPAAGTAGIKAFSGNDVFGYEFSSWTLGEGLDNECADATVCGTDKDSINISAIFNGTLTANYTKKQYVYLDISQTFSTYGKWSNPHAYLYTSAGYWDSSTGAGATGAACIKKGAMTLVPGETDIYYFDYGDAGSFGYKLAFTWDNKESQTHFENADVIYRSDLNAGTTLFVPVVGQTEETKNSTGHYFSKGYWRKYEPATGKTGYTLKVYDKIPDSGRKEVRSRDFVETDVEGKIFEATVDLEANTTYGIKFIRDNDQNYTYADQSLSNGTPLTMSVQPSNYKAVSLTTNVAGNYKFTLACTSGGDLTIQVDFPATSGDYRMVYNDLAEWSQGSVHTSSWSHPSHVITKKDGAEDIVSFFVAANATPRYKFQKVTGLSPVTWGDVETGAGDHYIAIPDSIKDKGSGVYNFHLKQENGSIHVVKIEKYTGNYYIRTDNAGSTKWSDFRAQDHQMTYSEYAKKSGYTHYYMHYCERGTNVKFCIANDHSMCITDTLIRDITKPFNENMDENGFLYTTDNVGAAWDKFSANIRFMWNEETNKISRAYLSSAQMDNILVLSNGSTASSEEVYDETGTVDKSGVDIKFSDKQNWIYEIVAKVKPSADVLVKVFGRYSNYYNEAERDQYFVGEYNSGTFDDSHAETLLHGTSDGLQTIRVLYDFKTNRMVTAWEPTGSTISDELQIDADLMIIREHQEPAQNIVLGHDAVKDTDGKIVSKKRIYGVMRFNRWILNNLSNPNDKTDTHAGSDYLSYHEPLSLGQQLPTYQRNLYYISFPFDVKVSEIFGFGTYGTHFAIQRYDGAGRAKNGYWIDSDPNWKWVPPTGTLNAYEGYVLSLSLSNMAANNTTVWANKTSEVELYFPSTTEGVNIETNTVIIDSLTVSDYGCKIERDSRNVKDSYWRCIGVPCYANYNNNLLDEDNEAIEWQTEDETLPFIYDINWQDKSLTAYEGKKFPFKAMHSYLVQYKGLIKWANTSVDVASSVVRNRMEGPKEYTYRLELSKDTTFCDQTFVRLSEKEEVTNGYDFDNDLWKQVYSSRSNIYTRIGNVNVAGNVLPMSEQTTVVPVGVQIAADGEYTFAMPDGTNGVGVTLVDNVTGTRTNLGLTDYSVTLTAGTHDGRFTLEIPAITQTPTDIEQTSADVANAVRKVMVDGILYIVKDGQVFDARGNRIQ